MQYRTATLLKGSQLADQERADEASLKQEQLSGTIQELERKGDEDTRVLRSRLEAALEDIDAGQLMTVERVKSIVSTPDDRGYRGEFGYREREVARLRAEHSELQSRTVVEESDLTLFLQSLVEAGANEVSDSGLKQAGFDVSAGRLIARAKRK